MNFLVQRSRNYYQSIGGIGIYNLFIYDDFWSYELNITRADMAIQFLKDNLNSSDTHQFVLVHEAVYEVIGDMYPYFT